MWLDDTYISGGEACILTLMWIERFAILCVKLMTEINALYIRHPGSCQIE